MNTFEQVWESSRQNSWSWAYPTVVAFGALFLSLLSWLRNNWVRRTMKLLVVLIGVYLATDASSWEIREKWRIRQDWTSSNWDSMTESQQSSAMTDGANLVLGPLLFGAMAAFVLGLTSMVLFFVRQLILRRQADS